MDAVSQLIQGSSDMHIHSGPFAQAVKAATRSKFSVKKGKQFHG
jgi:hypothetical protein